MSIEIRNAIIESARISDDDRGLLTVWLDLNYGGSGQGFGGYALYLPKSYAHHKPQSNFAGRFIWRCMEVAGITDWSKIVGKTVRARCEHSAVHAIGHIINDDWFCPNDDFKAMRGES